MLRKIFKTGNSVVVSLPKEALDWLGLAEGEQVSVDIDRENRQIIISLPPEDLSAAGVDEDFARQVAEFIAEYRPALEALARS
jgi:putative addiction module antidote